VDKPVDNQGISVDKPVDNQGISVDKPVDKSVDILWITCALHWCMPQDGASVHYCGA